MKIVICGRMAHKQEMYDLGEDLKAAFEVVIPQGAQRPPVPTAQKKDEFKYYFNEIQLADVVVVVNLAKDGVLGYIGGNTFLEMGFAYVLNKPIVLLNAPYTELPYIDEIQRMKPIILPKPDLQTLIATLKKL